MFRFHRVAGAAVDRGAGAPDRRRAVQLVDRVRRRDRAEGVPQARAGHQPRARAAAVPDRPRASPTSRRCRAGTSTRGARSPRRSASRSASSPTRSAAGSWRSIRSRTDPAALLDELGSLGRVTAELHNALASDAGDPAFSPEEPSSESLSLLTATIDEDIERIFVRLPDDERVAPIAGRGQDVRERIAARSQIGLGGRAIRTHGDFHLGQTLHTPRVGDHRLRGRAGAAAVRAPPEALAAARRGLDAALVRLRHLGQRDPARPAGAGGVRGARPRHLPRALLRDDRPALLPAGEAAIVNLLSIFELEKAIYELQYELDNRPDWLPIPVAGIGRLLESE